MRKCLLLMLVLSLAFSFALAENAAPYTPGSVTESLFIDAFERGDMLTLDMQFDLALSENAEALFGEDTTLLVSVAEALDHAEFSVGAGKIDNGLRVMLEADYAIDAQNAALSAALDMTKSGIVLTSSAIPGESLSAKWETLLSLAGMSDEEVAAVMSLRDADSEALFAELLAQLQPLLDVAMQIAAPYGETIMAHIAALPMVVNENVPAEYGYPAAATEVQVQVTVKAMGDLMIALAEQLKQDATLCALLDTVLAETETPDSPAPTTAQLCDIVIQAAGEELIDESFPLNIFVGMDAAGNPLYLNIVDENQDGTYLTISLITGKLEETGADLFNFDILSLNAEQEILDGFSFVLAHNADAANPNIMSAQVLLGAYAEGAEVLTFSLYTDNAAADAQGHSGYTGLIDTALRALDGETVISMNMNADISSSLTADGGETVSASGTIGITADDTEIPMTFAGGFTTEIVDSIPVVTMTEAAQLPELGISEWRESYVLRAVPQSAAQDLTETALETASPEALEALAGRAMTSLEQTLATLFDLLPEGLLAATESAALPVQP